MPTSRNNTAAEKSDLHEESYSYENTPKIT